MKTDELREKYLTFFESQGCVRRPSDVLVPKWDHSVLFTPAGMNQFKDHFLGRCKLDFTRATTCQKCLRTGDIENVGRTAYHHTFFEMLGNFSFGDYFKRDAIHWAWQFLTEKKWLGLDPSNLSATVYLDDDEAAGIWLDEIKLPADRLVRLGEDENFWPANAPSQGPDGVCGPCSEIYFHTPTGEVEIWNLVFTQFNRVGDPPDNLRPLPSKNIDTGMGLERTAAVLQGVDTNFHIDILKPLVEAAAEACGMAYDPESEKGRRLRRIADHVRACAFAIHENVYPGAKKEKYVVKRLLRRAVLDGHQLGIHEPFLHQLVPVVADVMKNPYPELGETVGRVAEVIESEESNFLGTIDAGLDRIDKIFHIMRKEHRGVVSGEEAAEMYQTHGFPPDLFETLAAEHNLAFDWDGYQRAMKKHGEDSGGGDRGALFARSGPSDSLIKAGYRSQFAGDEVLELDKAKVVGIIVNDRLCDRIDEIDHEHAIGIVLDKTPFYGEMGGQVGDRGELLGDTFRFEVIDTQIDRGLILHEGHLRDGEITLDAKVAARVDPARRQGIRRAHSATHLLHHALQQQLGSHAQQQGSKVDCDLLRFDFSAQKALSPEMVEKIESQINANITDAVPIDWKTMPLAEARTTGAMMLFGEKYPDLVRVVSIGDFSKELCGGTHLKNTGQIGLVRILTQESIAAGTRRITALTGPAALEHLCRAEALLGQTAATLRVPIEDVPTRVESLANEVRQLKKQLAAGARGKGISIDALLTDATEIGGAKVVLAEIPDANPAALRELIDQLRRKAAPIAVLLATRQGEKKVLLVAGFSRDLVEKGQDAVKWISACAKEIDGGGGGRPDMAQAGGKKPANLDRAFEVAMQTLLQSLG